ncbi:MAG: metallophosphoesterase family protein [Myxococcota bacterium]|jgi:predicted phosphodiesterase|nr:metallophosphoesterase family protein [Myxococcota bacterium]
MRYGIISDVHANRHALEAVVKSLDEERPDKVVCLGDVVGYGADPQACCEIVRKLAWITMLGNHDAAVSGRMNYSYYYDAAREALDRHLALLTPESVDWLASLPYSHRIPEQDLGFSHGSPICEEDFDYVFILEQARGLLPHYNELPQVTFIGHSHLTKCFVLDKDRATEIEEREFDLEQGRKYVITVGSVGQPRDYDARACYGIFDTETRRFEFRRVLYPVEQAARQVFQLQLAPNFGKRLFLGI